MKSLCIFCGSQSGKNPLFAEHAQILGRGLAQAEIRLIFGGGKIGLMGEVAEACLNAGGEVIGVMPRLLIARERAHRSLTQLIQVETMSERKETMAQLSDAFLALPGGLGTLDELFEMLTWNQIGLHTKPSFILNSADYYQDLLSFLSKGEETGLVYPLGTDLTVFQTPESLLAAMH
ncbi:TIGR00730 family Rossman fold protein [bacterium (Candidatus Blackallbacteria) CG17_big_fil_post_rev_8_21_14_2_50_48_46]|uniref:Cytokinin riboside 5'-monophosphate phosphoribohydrolase n=1 Tax=bacterium (Candidatus Blackallbacteria) CG17_big_fil_post_rev_8_21_14_2_50_48_46 TaxID=2014261 RepID=A0A2M7G3G6_9BACT|nr:MAG: TIGR00730 family Rossman fold protein [bacterium (Candidatus Blackallbacteria) CG18_big_fil_WC_8_21_14_2_50_49_26]PIW16376.1 MAG: TIGR00730 family Rossman fold protein [bacterium (Candidatus Blackallbacteria) CG17_big_fil_post_rev_8_21_14_2_50_48_46]PIW45389.1 MAG: TIGR00730 family Rossman fold protein [bacterium (Candidatus Blackallbacteria) CG13_big_fil_rev_8_21_14_2_50_49_14]